jgi:hypothetical protein
MTKLLISVGALALAAIAVADGAHAMPPNKWGQCMHMCTLGGRLTQSCMRTCGSGTATTTKQAATARPNPTPGTVHSGSNKH